MQTLETIAFTGKYRGEAHSNYNLKFNVRNEIPVVFHNGLSYDYHFIIDELENEFKGKFERLGGDTENYKTFSFSIGRKIKKEDDNQDITTFSYKIKFINSGRLMTRSLSNLVKDFNYFLE